MKTILFFLLFPALLHGQSAPVELLGEWQLQSLTIHHDTISLNKQYYLKIDTNVVFFNYDINDCHSTYNIDQQTITINSLRNCTEICCDGRFDTNCLDYINYNGTYILKDNLLIITRDKSKYYFIKK